MKLLTRPVAAKIPALYATEAQKKKKAVVKFFNPAGIGTWYAVEGSAVLDNGEEVPLSLMAIGQKAKGLLVGDLIDGPKDYSTCGKVVDVRFFGLVDLLEREWGYFSLRELESVRLPFGLTIERDLYFTPKEIQ